MDIQYGLPRLSQKSCKRLNQAAQRSSQSAFISSSTKGTQNQVVQTSHTRVSKRSRSINNLPKEQGASSSTKGNENQAEQTPLTRVSKRSQSINSLRKEQRASGQLPCLSQKHSDAVNRLTQSQCRVETTIQSRVPKRSRCIEGATEFFMNSVSGNHRSKAPKIKKKPSECETLLDAVIGKQLPIEPFRLPVPSYCEKCGAKKFAYESLHFCCGDRDIEIAVNEYPPELVRLFTSQEEDAMHFRTYARLYNNLFAFISISGNFDANTYKGIYVFKLHGQMYHYVPDLLPKDSRPKYLQLYFYDGQQESKNRLGCFPELRQDVIDILMRISERNPYATFFRSLKERQISVDTKILLHKNTVLDQRVYNAPAVDDVAVIWPDSSSSSESLSPHIMVSGKSATSHRIYHNYGCYDPLQYPLLFPCGDCGWTQGACKRNTQSDGFISPREYYAYKLQMWPNNMLLRAGRCFQQYIVDMYVKIENTRLDFFRNNQQNIRADLYQGILDSLDCGESIAYNVGRKVILPPTFIGGPRDMKKRYLNTMALVQRFGKPDLFVTITCNANWPEIKAELGVGELAQDRPDLVARIFRAKLLALKKEIMEKKVFGEVAAMVYIVDVSKKRFTSCSLLNNSQTRIQNEMPS